MRHFCRWRHRHLIVVALDDQRTTSSQCLHAVKHLQRVGPVAHQIAQQGKLLRALRVGMAQARIKGLDVGVNIRQQCQLHVAPGSFLKHHARIG